MSTGTDGQSSQDAGRERKNEEPFVQYYEFMFATARKVLMENVDAEDVIQNLFFKLVDRELTGCLEGPERALVPGCG
jgi:hypothetical protein